MPTNRNRKARRTAYRGISPKAVSLYQEAKASTDQQRIFDIARELHGELGLPDFEHSPIWPAEKMWRLLAPPMDLDHERSEAQARRIRAELETKTGKEKGDG